MGAWNRVRWHSLVRLFAGSDWESSSPDKPILWWRLVFGRGIGVGYRGSSHVGGDLDRVEVSTKRTEGTHLLREVPLLLAPCDRQCRCVVIRGVLGDGLEER